jgi:hypothetical protein
MALHTKRARINLSGDQITQSRGTVFPPLSIAVGLQGVLWFRQVHSPVEIRVTARVRQGEGLEDNMAYSGAPSGSTSLGPKPWRAVGSSHSSLVQARCLY